MSNLEQRFAAAADIARQPVFHLAQPGRFDKYQKRARHGRDQPYSRTRKRDLTPRKKSARHARLRAERRMYPERR